MGGEVAQASLVLMERMAKTFATMAAGERGTPID